MSMSKCTRMFVFGEKQLLWQHLYIKIISAYYEPISSTAWKVSVFGVILVRIFPHFD